MKKERETRSTKTKPLTESAPKTSADTQTKLSSRDYKISGNLFNAYYDGAGKLVFVLDQTTDDRKPNVLLIINPIGDRKWDDILANDFGMDLETIRPKVDNKYQKLDIDYSGLSVYEKLINDYNNGADLTSALDNLSDFRNSSSRRAAIDRLAAAQDTIKKTRETISKTGETMRELQSRIKKLRDKLSRQKKQVGKEPTKQSAAKILKTESQIDATNEKLKRAKKRLKNAQRRLAVAEEDAQIARHILDQKEEIKIKEEPKAKEMAEDVKPLFDQDPKIMDQDIAFKPIDFSIQQKQTSEPVVEKPEPIVFKPIEVEVPVQSAPISFVPPVIGQQPVIEEPKPTVAPQPEIVPQQPRPAPVLESITPIPTPNPVSEPVVRPVSPIAGPEQMSINTHKRPNALYYFMLVILIVLSVFTLWMYQKRSVDTVPDLSAPAKPEVVSEQPQVVEENTVESPFIQAEKAEPVTVTEQQPVAEEVTQPEPFIVSEPQPVVQESEPEVFTEPQMNNENTITLPIEQPSEVIVTEQQPSPSPDVVIEKPGYNVSGESKFVADENYQEESSSYNNRYSE